MAPDGSSDPRPLLVLVAASPPGQVRIITERDADAISPRMSYDPWLTEWIPAAGVRKIDLVFGRETRQTRVVHVAAHGDQDGRFYLYDDSNGEVTERGVWVAAADLARTLPRSTRLVVLTACHSKSAAEAFLARVPMVIAMRGPISSEGAIKFSAVLYRALRRGTAVRQAFEEARAQLKRSGADADMPTLHARSDDAPNYWFPDTRCEAIRDLPARLALDARALGQAVQRCQATFELQGGESLKAAWERALGGWSDVTIDRVLRETWLAAPNRPLGVVPKSLIRLDLARSLDRIEQWNALTDAAAKYEGPTALVLLSPVRQHPESFVDRVRNDLNHDDKVVRASRRFLVGVTPYRRDGEALPPSTARALLTEGFRPHLSQGEKVSACLARLLTEGDFALVLQVDLGPNPGGHTQSEPVKAKLLEPLVNQALPNLVQEARKLAPRGARLGHLLVLVVVTWGERTYGQTTMLQRELDVIQKQHRRNGDAYHMGRLPTLTLPPEDQVTCFMNELDFNEAQKDDVLTAYATEQKKPPSEQNFEAVLAAIQRAADDHDEDESLW